MVQIWFYDKNGTRIAKEEVNIDALFQHRGFLMMGNVMYKCDYKTNDSDAYYCSEIVPLVIRDVVEGLE